MKARKTRILLTGLALLGSVASSSAAVLYSENDGRVFWNSSTDVYAVNTTDPNDQVGRSGSGGVVHRVWVMPFQIPDLGMVADPFTDASIKIRVTGTNGTLTGDNVDMYALASRVQPTILPSDWFMAADDLTPGVVKLQDNFLTTATVASDLYPTSPGANTLLLDYLNAQYAGGANIGSYVFIRLNMDKVGIGSGDRYNLTTFNGVGASETEGNQLVYNTVPEPSAALLGSLGLLALFRRRR